jgi:hypothetical protein
MAEQKKKKSKALHLGNDDTDEMIMEFIYKRQKEGFATTINHLVAHFTSIHPTELIARMKKLRKYLE